MPTMINEYVNAFGTFFSGFLTILKSEAVHSKPNNPKIATFVPSKMLNGPLSINGVKWLRFIWVKHMNVVTIKGKTVHTIKIYWPIDDNFTPKILSNMSAARVYKPRVYGEKEGKIWWRYVPATFDNNPIAIKSPIKYNEGVNFKDN